MSMDPIEQARARIAAYREFLADPNAVVEATKYACEDVLPLWEEAYEACNGSRGEMAQWIAKRYYELATICLALHADSERVQAYRDASTAMKEHLSRRNAFCDSDGEVRADEPSAWACGCQDIYMEGIMGCDEYYRIQDAVSAAHAAAFDTESQG